MVISYTKEMLRLKKNLIKRGEYTYVRRATVVDCIEFIRVKRLPKQQQQQKLSRICFLFDHRQIIFRYSFCVAEFSFHSFFLFFPPHSHRKMTHDNKINNNKIHSIGCHNIDTINQTNRKRQQQ